jgi:hypothetical protein
VFHAHEYAAVSPTAKVLEEFRIDLPHVPASRNGGGGGKPQGFSPLGSRPSARPGGAGHARQPGHAGQDECSAVRGHGE